jgi:hypothetical protein
MKKSKLIELLNALPGDPDVLLWNGMVGDWMDIGKLVQSDLVKMTLESYLKACRYEACQDAGNWEVQLSEEEISELTKRHRAFQYESNNYVTEEDIKQKRYMSKKVVFIDAKPRGVSTFDRLGTIEY